MKAFFKLDRSHKRPEIKDGGTYIVYYEFNTDLQIWELCLTDEGVEH